MDLIQSCAAAGFIIVSTVTVVDFHFRTEGAADVNTYMSQIRTVSTAKQKMSLVFGICPIIL